MADTITCPRCKDRLTVPPARKAGTIRCPRCGASQKHTPAGAGVLPVLVRTGALLALAGLVLVVCVGLGWLGIYLARRVPATPAEVKPAPQAVAEANPTPEARPEARPEGRPVRPSQPELTRAPEIKPALAPQPEPAPEVKRVPPSQPDPAAEVKRVPAPEPVSPPPSTEKPAEKPVARPTEDPRAIAPDQYTKLLTMIKPHPDEAKWDEIPWMTNLYEARKKAAAEGKPLFVWSANADSLGCT